MIAAATRVRDAVVIGVACWGLEAANGLSQRGMRVTVVHLMPWLMERQLDAPAAGMLQASLEARGIRFVLGAQTREIAIRGRRARGATGDGRELPADLVVSPSASGPTSSWHARRGSPSSAVCRYPTRCKRTTRASTRSECVRAPGPVVRARRAALRHARVCALHLAEAGIFAYRGSVLATRLKVTGVEVFSAGEFAGGAGTEDIVYADALARVYRKLVLRDGHLVGAVMVGDTLDAAWYQDLIQSRRDVSGVRDRLIFAAHSPKP